MLGCSAVTSSSTTRAPRGRRATRPSGDDREAAILATARQLLETKKFADISVDDLAKGAGISRPTFYFYFPSKEAVVLSLLDPLIKRADTGFDSALEAMPADPRRAIRRGIEIFFSSFGSDPATARAGTEALNSSPEFRALWSGPHAEVDRPDRRPDHCRTSTRRVPRRPFRPWTSRRHST